MVSNVSWTRRALRAAGASIAFLMAFTVAVTFELLVVAVCNAIFVSNINPRGLGWWLLPLAAGIWSARFMPKLRLAHLVAAFGSVGTAASAAIGLLVWWIVVVGNVWLSGSLADAFDPRFDFAHTLQWLAGPPIAAYVLGVVVASAVKGPFIKGKSSIDAESNDAIDFDKATASSRIVVKQTARPA